MRHILHSESVPSGIAAAFRAEPHPTNPRQAWKDFDIEAKRELREHLWELQYGLCAYCERALDLEPGASSIEHIVPKTPNPGFTFRYNNLVLCCVDPKTCNLRKKVAYFAGFDVTGRWSLGFIAPTQARCEISFRYGADGAVSPTQIADEQEVVKTIAILNLNHPPLVTERREYLEAINKAADEMADQMEAREYFLQTELELGSGKPFYSAKRQNCSIS